MSLVYILFFYARVNFVYVSNSVKLEDQTTLVLYAVVQNILFTYISVRRNQNLFLLVMKVYNSNKSLRFNYNFNSEK